MGKFLGLCLGKLLFGWMPKLWVTLKSRQHQVGHRPLAAICASVGSIQRMGQAQEVLEIRLFPVSELTQQYCFRLYWMSIWKDAFQISK